MFHFEKMFYFLFDLPVSIFQFEDAFANGNDRCVTFNINNNVRVFRGSCEVMITMINGFNELKTYYFVFSYDFGGHFTNGLWSP